MIGGKSVLGVVTARGGSKGVPRKNLLRFDDRTLTQWAVVALQRCELVDRVIVSTEDEEIAEAARLEGDVVPFLRPHALAEDGSSSLSVLQHVLEAEKEEGRAYDLVALCEPSCPFRSIDQIRAALGFLHNNSTATSAVTVYKVSDHHPIRMKRMAEDGRISPYCDAEPEGLRRQDQQPAYLRNGGVYVFRSDLLLEGTLYGSEVYGVSVDPHWYGVNIDEPVDLLVARAILEEARQEGKSDLLLPFS